MKKTILQIPKSAANEKGMVLVVALLLIAVMVLLGSTAVMTTSTDLKISGNYRASENAFYAAEAGTEEARARIRANFTPTTGATGLIDDPVSNQTSTTWSVFIGGAGPYTSIQSALTYIVRIEHQISGGSVLYWGDTNNDGLYERTTTSGANMRNIYLVTSTGSALGAQKTITTEMSRLPPITVPGALYVKAATSINGNQTNINGMDQCGGANMPGIVTTLATSTVTTNGGPTIAGSPSSIAGGSTNMDIQTMINSQKDTANYVYNVTSDTHTGMNWGTPTPGASDTSPSSCAVSNIVYYNTNDTDIQLTGGTSGCGLLLIEGDLDISGGFSWYGVVIVSGSVTFTGVGGSTKNITGGVLAGGSVDADLIGGATNIVYCSSAISSQTENQPLKRLSWKEQNI